MERTIFSPSQLRFLSLLKQVKSDKQIEEINDLLSKYFAQKAIEEADALREQGAIDASVVNTWKTEHMRTPYN